jgi:hypothetical protein
LIFSGQGLERGFDALDLLVCEIERIQVTQQAGLLGRAEFQSQPPAALILVKQIAFGRLDVATVQDGVQTVLGLGCQPGHLVAMSNQGAQFLDFLGRNPDAHQQFFGVQASQN